jgi:hypothetical protein
MKKRKTTYCTPKNTLYHHRLMGTTLVRTMMQSVASAATPEASFCCVRMRRLKSR